MLFPDVTQFIPASVVIEEHHIGVYSSKLDEHMIKAPHPRNLLHGSLVSLSLAAAVINGKYVNAVPLYRLEKGFGKVRAYRSTDRTWRTDDPSGEEISGNHV